MEIERQFLVDATALPNLEDVPYEAISQGYISFYPEIRIRKWSAGYLLTVKSGNGLVRQEQNMPISRTEYESLLPRLAEGSFLIEKLRYHLPIEGGLVVELDIHQNRLAGFQYAEVEFPDEETALRFQPLPWFGREVTNLAGFSNRALATVASAEEFMKYISD